MDFSFIILDKMALFVSSLPPEKLTQFEISHPIQITKKRQYRKYWVNATEILKKSNKNTGTIDAKPVFVKRY